MNIKWIGIIGLSLITSLGFSGYWAPSKSEEVFVQNSSKASEQLTTEEYIRKFEPKSYELAGTNFFNERYSPLRLNKPLDEIDTTFDYDFTYLKQVSKHLEKIDRRKALKAIFEKITTDAKSDTEKHLAVLKFLHKAAYHNPYVQPMYENKQAVLDPIVLLELGEMRCGAMARIGADLFESAGYQTRLVQVAAHTTAEIFYERDWHLFESDLAGGGMAIRHNGHIPSVFELSQTPYLIDKIPTHFAAFHTVGAQVYPSYYFFSSEAYNDLVPSYYYKTATIEQAAASIYFGWEIYKTITNAWKLSNIQKKYEPSGPIFTHIFKGKNYVQLSWEPPVAADGYRVYISKVSRGWQYQNFVNSEEIKPYWHGGWKPEMYDSMFREPPSDVRLFTTTNTSVKIKLPKGEIRYVTVMPYDHHGESVGRKLYNMSDELMLTNP